ncbi:MAG: cytochrome c biogenesis protein CcsA [Nitrospinota bacterium]
MAFLFFSVATFCYFLATLAHLFFLFTRGRHSLGVATGALLAGFFFHTLSLALGLEVTGIFPYANFLCWFCALTWVLVLVYLLAALTQRRLPLKAWFIPAIFIIAAFGRHTYLGGSEFLPAVKNLWLAVHIIVSFLGSAAFAVLFGAGVMYIIQDRHIKTKHLGGAFHRLPSLEALDQLNQVSLYIGFPLSIMGLITGAIWVQLEKGSYWRWDPIKTWPLLIILVSYGIVFLCRLTKSWRGWRAAMFAVVGFFLVVATFLAHLLPGD